MSITQPFASLVGLLLTIAAVAGCGNADGPQRYPIDGSITFHGAPLDQGTIQFTPTGNAGIGTGAAISNGTYAIPRDKGLPPGQYRVMIFSAKLDAAPSELEEVGPPGSAELMPERIPPKYNALSEITVEVKPEGENTFDFQVK